MQSDWKKGTSILLIAGIFFATALQSARAATCTDAESCNAAIKLLQAKLAQGQQKIQEKQQTAYGYKQALADLGDKLQTTQQQIKQTQGKISDTNAQITQINGYIDSETQQLQQLQAQLESEIVQLYTESQTPQLAILLSSSSFSEVTNDMDYLKQLQDNIQKRVNDTRALQADLQKQKDNLQGQKDDLSNLNDSLTGHQKDLSYQTNQTNYLLSATKAQIQSYAADQAVIKQQIAETQRKLQSLINEAHWGNDIVSAPAAGWSYNQLNYYDTLGYSPYTVHDYGCFITSMAMVATYYGHHITPSQIANHPSWFTRGGYAVTGAIAGGIGLSIQDKRAVDWSVVDDELRTGHPVIVSIYLPQVGAINSDGSSHFIVLQGKSGNSYLMQDPLGQNRSYGLNYVRSMVILK
ncbi:MAG TPA: C39 family peptidase [Candidatus Andersenbacteria bacterium]|nr:C39 family peptidase [Candidatus Andersenbacteria bacterium]